MPTLQNLMDLRRRDFLVDTDMIGSSIRKSQCRRLFQLHHIAKCQLNICDQMSITLFCIPHFRIPTVQSAMRMSTKT